MEGCDEAHEPPLCTLRQRTLTLMLNRVKRNFSTTMAQHNNSLSEPPMAASDAYESISHCSQDISWTAHATDRVPTAVHAAVTLDRTPPETRPDVSIVVPLYNERDRLRQFGPTIVSWLSKAHAGRAELVLVDDGSTDDTWEVVSEIACLGERSGIRVRSLCLPHAGKGAALRRGILLASGRVIAFTDVDLATPIEDLESLLGRTGTGALVIASRAMATSRLVVRESWLRERLGRWYNRFVRHFLGLGVADTQCGAKAAMSEVWTVLLGHSSEQQWAWDVEIIAIASAVGVPIEEMAVRWRHDARSRVHVFNDGLSMLMAVPRIWWHVRRLPRINIRRLERVKPERPEPVLSTTVQAGLGQGNMPLAADIGPSLGNSSRAFTSRQARTLIEHGDHWWFRAKADWISQLLDVSGPSDGGLLADVGAGSGTVASRVHWSGHKVLVEPSRHLVVNTDGLVVVRGVAEALPFADRSVEVVLLCDVMEHLINPVAALMEAYRVLSDQGRIVVTVPAHAWLWSAADSELGHYRRYFASLLDVQLREAGFVPMSLHHIFSWLVPPVYFVRRLRPQSVQDQIGLDVGGALIAMVAQTCARAERAVGAALRMPVGTSLIGVGKKQPSIQCGCQAREGLRPARVPSTRLTNVQ